MGKLRTEVKRTWPLDQKLPGDITCDWKVNVPDLLAVLNAWGPCPPTPPQEPFTKTCHADLNDDGVVALDDLLTVVLNWAP